MLNADTIVENWGNVELMIKQGVVTQKEIRHFLLNDEWPDKDENCKEKKED